MASLASAPTGTLLARNVRSMGTASAQISTSAVSRCAARAEPLSLSSSTPSSSAQKLQSTFFSGVESLSTKTASASAPAEPSRGAPLRVFASKTSPKLQGRKLRVAGESLVLVQLQSPLVFALSPVACTPKCQGPPMVPVSCSPLDDVDSLHSLPAVQHV